MNERELLVDCLRRLNRSGVTYYLTGSMASNCFKADVPRLASLLIRGVPAHVAMGEKPVGFLVVTEDC